MSNPDGASNAAAAVTGSGDHIDPAEANEVIQQVTNAEIVDEHDVPSSSASSDTTSDPIGAADAVVIGLGSAGERVALMLAEAGWRVVGFDPGRVGGECPYLACVPSKALLHDARAGERTWADAVARRNELAQHLDDSAKAGALEAAGVRLVRESATIVSPRRVRSENHDVTATHVIIATGASAVRPPIEGIDRPEVWFSHDALASDELPEGLVCIGGGAIGSELSQVYARFGSDVTLIEAEDQLIADAEPQVSSVIAEALRDSGVTIHLGREVEAIESAPDGVSVRLASGNSIAADRVLVATGVEPRLNGLGLDMLDIDADDLDIDAWGRVAETDWLWAAGDVTPQSAWTHGANYQARSLTDRLLDRAWLEPPTVMPRCVFTDPPLGVVGQTVASARSAGIDAVVGTADFGELVRAHTDEVELGLAAVVADRSTGQIIGASIAGVRADDLVQVITAFMATSATVETARRTVFPFPTFGQVLEQAIDALAQQLRGSDD